jgi:hypothetical protein
MCRERFEPDLRSSVNCESLRGSAPRSTKSKTPEATAIAIESGTATIATVSAAIISPLKKLNLYPSASTVAIFGR